MLTLERREGQTIVITHKGETLEVKVALIRDNKVKLSFDAPESFEIWREEVGETEITL